MGMHLDKALGIHPEVLRVRTERTRILASNIAHENTPGYQARDIDFKAALASVDATSNDFPLEMGSSELMYRVPNNPSRDGNTVEVGVEQAEFTQNVTDFNTSLTFIRMKINGLEKAISG